MGSPEVLKVLKEGSQLTAPEIASIVDQSVQSVSRIIRSLIKDVTEDVGHRELTPEEKLERYGKQVNCKICIYWLEK